MPRLDINPRRPSRIDPNLLQLATWADRATAQIALACVFTTPTLVLLKHCGLL